MPRGRDAAIGLQRSVLFPTARDDSSAGFWHVQLELPPNVLSTYAEYRHTHSDPSGLSMEDRRMYKSQDGRFRN